METTSCIEPGCEKPAKSAGMCRKHYHPKTTYPPEHLKASEVRRLLEVARTDGTAGVRNAAILWTLYRTGLRISEALALRPHDVDFDEGTVFVRRGKGSKARTVGIDESAYPALREWIAARPSSEFLFSTRTGKLIQTSYIRGLMARLGREAGIPKRCHAHMLRHTLAVEMVTERIAIEYIR